jgi:adenylylsulfate kinase/chloramphenicol 3-O phosphotransferase
MNKGKIIFLNGVTSSGKTSIVDSLQARNDVFFYVVANDLFEQTIGDKYLHEDYWKYLSKAILLMYHTAKLFSDKGENVIVDGILVERPEIAPHYSQMKEILSDNPLHIVDVSCPIEICEERNQARSDRHKNQSVEQKAIMASGISYRIKVETHKNTPDECAEQIVQAIFF